MKTRAGSSGRSRVGWENLRFGSVGEGRAAGLNHGEAVRVRSQEARQLRVPSI